MKKIFLSIIFAISIINCSNKPFERRLKKEVKEITEKVKEKEKQANKEVIEAKVIKVYDGDTVTLEDKTKIRLFGIDAPERKQQGGDYSQKVLSDLLLNKKAKFVVMDTDRYGRKVSKIYVGDIYVNEYLIKRGAAHYYEEYAKNENDLKQAYETAKKNKVGIFNQRYQLPSEYRKQHNKG